MQIATPTTAKHAYDALKALGFSRPYISKILPDWWDNDLLKTSAGVLQFTLILKQRLGLEINFDDQGKLVIDINHRDIRFKHRQGATVSDLNQAASIGRAMARLITHNPQMQFTRIPSSPSAIRDEILTSYPFVGFNELVEYCWKKGIPVLYLDKMPPNSKRAAGMAINFNGRPVIILGHQLRQSSRQLFVLAHELGHIALNHIQQDNMLIDEEISHLVERVERTAPFTADSDERDADQFAIALIRGKFTTEPVKLFSGMSSAAVLASKAAELSALHQIDPGHLLLSWARDTGNWPRASQATTFFPNHDAALTVLEKQFVQNAYIENLSEENQSFISTVQGFQLPESLHGIPT